MFLFLFYIPTHSVCWDRVVEIRSGRVSFSECSCWTKQGWIKGWTFITAQHNKRVKLENANLKGPSLSLSVICSSFDGVWGSGSFETSVPHDLHYCLRWRRLFLTLRLLRHSLPLHQRFYLVPFKYPFSHSHSYSYCFRKNHTFSVTSLKCEIPFCGFQMCC